MCYYAPSLGTTATGFLLTEADVFAGATDGSLLRRNGDDWELTPVACAEDEWRPKLSRFKAFNARNAWATGTGHGTEPRFDGAHWSMVSSQVGRGSRRPSSLRRARPSSTA